ncbi:unnamed protein product [Calypogeia fissa]
MFWGRRAGRSHAGRPTIPPDPSTGKGCGCTHGTRHARYRISVTYGSTWSWRALGVRYGTVGAAAEQTAFTILVFAAAQLSYPAGEEMKNEDYTGVTWLGIPFPACPREAFPTGRLVGEEQSGLLGSGRVSTPVDCAWQLTECLLWAYAGKYCSIYSPLLHGSIGPPCYINFEEI